MKNFKKAFLLSLLLPVFCFISCGDRSQQREAQVEEEVSPPEQIISLEEAQSLYKNYSERRVGLIQAYEDSVNLSQKNESKFDVARYTVYDYKTIKQYIAYIDQEAKKAGVEISSLRFYYSNYPDQKEFPDGTPIVHPRQNAVFIVPAIGELGDDFAITLEDVGDEGQQRAVLLNGELQPIEDKMGMVGSENDKAFAGFVNPTPMNTSNSFNNGGFILNHGGAYPPPYR